MVAAMATFVGFAFLGDATARLLHLPIPGPVLGLIALAATLLAIDGVRRRRGVGRNPARFADLQALARGLIAAMGVMFVPAGVGVLTEFDAVRRDGLAIAVALIGSTLASLWVTGAVFTLWLHRYGAPRERIVK